MGIHREECEGLKERGTGHKTRQSQASLSYTRISKICFQVSTTGDKQHHWIIEYNTYHLNVEFDET